MIADFPAHGKDEKEWSDAIIGAAPNIVVGLGERSEILIFNKFAEKATGYTAQEVTGREWIDLMIPEAARPEIHRVWQEIVENHLVEHHFENPILTKAGEQRLIRWSNTVLTEGAKFKLMLSIGEDITERKETERALRELVRDILAAEGYRVLSAGDGAQALQLAAAHEGPIHLLVTDVVMSHVSGKVLADQLAPSHPEMRALFTSGYTDNAIVHHGVLDEGVQFLSKPFEMEALIRKVREVLKA